MDFMVADVLLVLQDMIKIKNSQSYADFNLFYTKYLQIKAQSIFSILITQIMYKPTSLFLLLVVSLSICQSSFRTGQYSCLFHIQPTDTKCQTFLFNSCTYSESCGQYCVEDVTSKTWGYCLYKCCQESYGELSYQTLSDCKDKNDKTIIYLAITITFGIVWLMIIPLTICLIVKQTNWKLCCNNFKLSWFRRCSSPQEIIDAPNDDNQHSATNLNSHQKGWHIPQSLEAKSWQKENCTICLSENPNIQLNCTHYFHALCILTWEQKARTCPLCLLAFSSQDKVIKICQKCFRQERVIRLAQFGMYQFCDGCAQQEKRGLALEESMRQ